MWLSGAIDTIDNVFDHAVRLRLRRISLNEGEYNQCRLAAIDISEEEFLQHQVDVIDRKTSALLTHVSIIIAVIAFLAEKSSLGPLRYIYSAELVLYIAVAVACLRCVRIIGPHSLMKRSISYTTTGSGIDDIKRKVLELYRTQVQSRRELYRLILDITVIITIALLITIIIDVFFFK